MPNYSATEYFAVPLESIHIGKDYPFPIFILLPLSQRLVLYIPESTVIQETRIQKLKKNQTLQVYIPMGAKETFQQLQNPPAPTAVPTPMPVAAPVSAPATPPAPAAPVAVAPEPPPKPVEVVPPPPSPEATASAFAAPDVAALIPLVETPQPAAPAPEILSDVVELLKDQMLQLSEEVEVRNSLSEETKIVIKDATLKIEDQLEVISSQNPKEPEFQLTIKNVTEHIKDEIIKIKALDQIGDQQKLLIQETTESIESELRTLQQAQSQEDLGKITAKIQNSLLTLKGLVQEKPEEIITSALQALIATAEDKLGATLDLSKDSSSQSVAQPPTQNSYVSEWLFQELHKLKNYIEGGQYKPQDLLGYLQTILAQIEKGLASTGPLPPIEPLPLPKYEIKVEDLEGTGLVDPKVIEELKSIITMQEKMISQLTEKLKATRPEFDAMRDRWFTFQMLTKRKLDPSDQMKAKTLTQQMQDFEMNFFTSFNEERKNLKKVTRRFFKIISSENKSSVEDEVDADDMIILGPTHQPKANPLEENGGAPGEPGAELAPGNAPSAPTPTNHLGEIEQLHAENRILQVQLENAQALMETTTKKMSELEEMLKSSGEYATTLEEELGKSKKSNATLMEESQSFEGEKRRLLEGIEDANTNLYKVRAEESADTEKLAVLNDQLKQLEKSLDFYKKKFGSGEAEITPEVEAEFPRAARALILQKEDKIQSLTKQLTSQIEKATDLKKELESIKSEDRKFETERKELGKRLEKQRMEIETIHSHQKSLELKNSAANQLLVQARKTITKLTEETAELRADRTKYIRKTNEALSEHKTLITEALSLNSQIQAEMKKSRAAEEQLDGAKNREKGLNKQIQNMQTQLQTAETAKKKLEQEIKKQGQSQTGGEITSLKAHIADLEKRIETLKRENKEYQAQFVAEQTKNKNLSQQLRKKAS